MTRWVRVQAAVAGAVLASGLGAVVAGSGGSGVTLAGPQVLRLIRAAPAALSAYPSITMSMTLSVHGQQQSVSVHESGSMSPDGRDGTITLDLPGGRGSVTFTAVGGTVYAPARAGSYAATTGKHWIALHLSTSARGAVMGSGNDALGYLRLMPGATGPVQVLGHQRIDGAPTTHYRVTIDLLEAYRRVPPQLQTASLQQLQSLGVRTMPVEIWIDRDGVARQTTFRLAVQGTSLDGRIRLSGSEKAVTVTAPAPSDTFTVPDAVEFGRLALGTGG